MSSFRLIFVAVTLVVVAIGYCHCIFDIEVVSLDPTPNNGIQFDLIKNQPVSFREKIMDSLKPTKTIVASEGGNKAFKLLNATLYKSTKLIPLAGALPAIQSILSESDNWSKNFAKTVPKGVQNMIRENEITKIMTYIRSLRENVNQLTNVPDLTVQVQKSKVDLIDSRLLYIIKRFGDGDSPYRAYSTFAVPVLLALAPFAAHFQPILSTVAEDLAKLSITSCTFAETIADYFQLTLLNRLNEIAIEANISSDDEPHRAIIEAREFRLPFNPDGYKLKRDYIRCGKIDKGETVPAIFLALRDKLNKKNDYFGNIGADCINDYFLLVRNRLETTFGKAFKLIDQFCAGRNRKKIPTGKGWLFIELGAFRGRLSTGVCDPEAVFTSKDKFCDPFVQINIDNEPPHTTEAKKNVEHWTTYDDTYFSNKISKKSKVAIAVTDKNVVKNTDMFNKSMSIDELVKLAFIEDDYSKLYVNAIWKDEYQDENNEGSVINF